MALPNLSGSNIQDTYQRVLHTDGATLFDGTGSTILTSTELNSLKTINSNEIANADWQYMSTLNQHVSISSDVQFRHITASGHISASGTVFANDVNAAAGIAIANKTIDYNAPNLRIKNTGLEIASGPLTASIVSASGNIFASQLHLPWMGDIIWDGDTNTRIETSGNPEDLDIYADRHIRLFADGNVEFGNGPNIRYNNSDNVFNMNVQSEGVSILTTNITASGDISSSGNIYAEDYYISNEHVIATGTGTTYFGRVNKKTEITGSNIKLGAPVTASGVISASGYVYGDRGVFASRLQTPAWRFTDISITSDNGPVNFTSDLGTTVAINTMTGDVSASGIVSASKGIYIGSNVRFVETSTTQGQISNAAGGTLTNLQLKVGTTEMQTLEAGTITATGNVSSSYNSTASFAQIITPGRIETSNGGLTASIVSPNTQGYGTDEDGMTNNNELVIIPWTEFSIDSNDSSRHFSLYARGTGGSYAFGKSALVSHFASYVLPKGYELTGCAVFGNLGGAQFRTYHNSILSSTTTALMSGTAMISGSGINKSAADISSSMILQDSINWHPGDHLTINYLNNDAGGAQLYGAAITIKPVTA